ncbi:MAG: glutaredoxin domain-containing protein [Patescibacteria group bacterium]
MIKIYTTPSCVYCKMAKEFFKTNGVQYEEYDVAADEKARNEMIEKSRQLGVPVIEINNEVFVGFDKDALVKALGIKK